MELFLGAQAQVDCLSSFEIEDEMSQSDKPLRDQMTEAMENIRRQLELLRSGPTIGEALDDRSVINDLETEFEALKEARANLGPNDR